MIVANRLDLHQIYETTETTRLNDFGYFPAVGRVAHDYQELVKGKRWRKTIQTMSQAKDNSGLVDRILNPDAVHE